MNQLDTAHLQDQPADQIQPLSQEQIKAAIELLDSWCNVSDTEAQEQCETGEYLKEVLDKQRLSARPLITNA